MDRSGGVLGFGVRGGWGWRAWLVACLVVAGVVGQGCGSGGGQVRVRSVLQPVADVPSVRVAAYRPLDSTSAEVILTDLSEEELELGSDIGPLGGRITQLTMFLQPSPGDTPIAPTAVNTTVRHVVVTRGQVGVYGGGGFLLPRDRPGAEVFRGRMSEAPMRLLSRSAGFADRLGPSVLEASFSARRDDAFVARASLRLEELVSRAWLRPEVEVQGR